MRLLLKSPGPGIITGASDEDPSGIATYSVAGAQLGTSLLWTALLTWPLMAAVQMMCARIGKVTGQGLAGNFKQRFPGWLLRVFVMALLAANTINIAADLAGMADAAAMLSGVNAQVARKKAEPPSLANQVAEQLMEHDALGAHARDELGISETFRARPIQAALASAGSFAVGAAMPLLVTALVPASGLILLVAGTSLVFLALLGGLAARAGGAGVAIGAIRVTFWGALAMALTAGVGWLFGTVA